MTISLPLQDGRTSLHYASSHGRRELCELLIGIKADVGAKDEVLGVKPPTDVGTTSVPTDVGTMRTYIRTYGCRYYAYRTRSNMSQHDDDVGMRKVRWEKLSR